MSGSDLRIENLTKSYGSHVALDGVSIEVAPGEICGLLGPNGAGKTTLVSIISGLRVADSGRVTIGGQDIARGGRSTRALVGLAGQETGIYPTITVRANLELFAGIAGLSRVEQAHRMDELAAIFELEPLMDRLARNLSGGEKRRLHTAMSMLHRPPVLLLDEPTTGVDIATRARFGAWRLNRASPSCTRPTTSPRSRNSTRRWRSSTTAASLPAVPFGA